MSFWGAYTELAFIADYLKKEKLASTYIGLAVTHYLSAIPNSNHPAVIVQPEQPSKKIQTRLEFTFFGGYIPESRMDVAKEYVPSIGGTAKFAGYAQYELEAAIRLTRHFDILMMYRRLQTIIRVNTPDLFGYGEITTNQNFYEVGANYNLIANKVVSLYIGISVGALNMLSRNRYFRDVWYFITGAHGGVKFYLSEWIGLRLQAEMLYQVHPANAPFLYSMNVYN